MSGYKPKNSVICGRTHLGARQDKVMHAAVDGCDYGITAEFLSPFLYIGRIQHNICFHALGSPSAGLRTR